ncbi:MAG: FMN-binding protein [Firmicutes bacterium]|nr:FMN-binding protein [Bacillota bacterium]
MKYSLKKTGLLLLTTLLLCICCAGCGDKDSQLQDGYYSAEASSYSHGWKEFVSICISNGKLVTVEYNAKNESGFIKSWDMNYMRNMEQITGTYPNLYTRTYAADLLSKGDAQAIDTITGASSSGKKFKLLAEAAMEQAKKGDASKFIVQMPPEEE